MQKRAFMFNHGFIFPFNPVLSIFALHIIYNIMKTLYVFLLCLYTSLTVAAQPLCQIKHFSVNSGLSQGVVVNIMQDKKDFFGSPPGMD